MQGAFRNALPPGATRIEFVKKNFSTVFCFLASKDVEARGEVTKTGDGFFGAVVEALENGQSSAKTKEGTGRT